MSDDPTEGVRLLWVSVRLVRGGAGRLNEDRIGRYVAMDPASWPRLHLVRRGREYMLVDGRHRITAARRLGLARVRASVVSAATWLDFLSRRRRLSWRRNEG